MRAMLLAAPSLLVDALILSAPSSTAARVHRIDLSGFQSLRFKSASGGLSLLDARRTMVVVSNGREESTPPRRCSSAGPGLNRYPLTISETPGVTLSGGRFAGTIALRTDWAQTYCNSAAILWDRAPAGRMWGQRIDRVWDAVRLGPGAPDLRIQGVWISNVRDDAIENDYLQRLTLDDSLIDGTLIAVSLLPNRTREVGPATGTVTVSRSLVRLITTGYKGRTFFGSLAKADARAPRIRFENSVVAIEPRDGRTWSDYWRWTWTKTSASDSWLLWLSDSPIPPAVAAVPNGITVLTGASARAKWIAARARWLERHHDLRKLPSDYARQPCVSRFKHLLQASKC